MHVLAYVRPVRGRALLGSASLSECKWDHTHGNQQEQVKRASNEVRFNERGYLLFHNSAVRFFFIDKATVAAAELGESSESDSAWALRTE
jgi:hypothetical protein